MGGLLEKALEEGKTACASWGHPSSVVLPAHMGRVGLYY